MASKSAEKSGHTNALQGSMVVVRENVSPLTSSSDDVTMDEADRKLEAMGYTPVSKSPGLLTIQQKS